jgi:hypothetical protein
VACDVVVILSVVQLLSAYIVLLFVLYLTPLVSTGKSCHHQTFCHECDGAHPCFLSHFLFGKPKQHYWGTLQYRSACLVKLSLLYSSVYRSVLLVIWFIRSNLVRLSCSVFLKLQSSLVDLMKLQSFWSWFRISAGFGETSMTW